MPALPGSEERHCSPTVPPGRCIDGSAGFIIARPRNHHARAFRRIALLEAIDARAGVLLGFAAALTALTPQHVDILVEIGRAAAVPGAIAALATFWPREYGNLDVELVADSAGSELVFIERNLIQAQKEIVLGLTELIAKKIRRLKTAMILIASASLSIAVGLVLD